MLTMALPRCALDVRRRILQNMERVYYLSIVFFVSVVSQLTPEARRNVVENCEWMMRGEAFWMTRHWRDRHFDSSMSFNCFNDLMNDGVLKSSWVAVANNRMQFSTWWMTIRCSKSRIILCFIQISAKLFNLEERMTISPVLAVAFVIALPVVSAQKCYADDVVAGGSNVNFNCASKTSYKLIQNTDTDPITLPGK